MKTVTNSIIRKIYRNKRGWVFSPKDFVSFGSRAAVDQALSRLVKRGMIRRLSRGLYDYPKQSEALGTLSPTRDAIARALADDKLAFPSGAVAANMLGLSTQVPAKPVYLTNASSRTTTLKNLIVYVKHARIPIMRNLSYDGNLVLQALFYLRKPNITQSILDACARILSDADIRSLQKAMHTMPSWLADTIHHIAHIQHGYIQRTA